jgi:kumamolisin
VAAAGDPDSGYFTVSPNSDTGASEAGVSGGTSASSPFWAGVMLLIEQYAKQHGVNKLGFVNPMLYFIASHQNPSAPSFHDVTIGGNRYYDCTPGWDFATGLGSPDVSNLAHAIVDYLKSNPAA